MFLALAAILAAPWAFWVSKTLWHINQNVTGLVERTKNNESRLEVLEALLPRHIPHK